MNVKILLCAAKERNATKKERKGEIGLKYWFGVVPST